MWPYLHLKGWREDICVLPRWRFVMELGFILVLVGVILAVISAFVTNHTHRLLTAAVVLIGVGVLVGGGAVTA